VRARERARVLTHFGAWLWGGWGGARPGQVRRSLQGAHVLLKHQGRAKPILHANRCETVPPRHRRPLCGDCAGRLRALATDERNGHRARELREVTTLRRAHAQLQKRVHTQQKEISNWQRNWPQQQQQQQQHSRDYH
jgi:hypothetical protein